MIAWVEKKQESSVRKIKGLKNKMQNKVEFNH